MDWDRVDELFAEGERLSAADRDALLGMANSPEADQVRRLWRSADDAGVFLSASLIARAEPTAHFPGQLVTGRFMLIQLLGAGGMGEVFSARDERLGRVVALKFIRPELAASPEARRRLEREARALCSLIHPSICTLHDIVWEGDEPLLVMECMEGETLDARLRQGPLAVPALVAVTLEMLEGLDCVHRAGLVHRDLKPANVMLTERGAKLFDFGIATWNDPPAGDPIETREGLVIGSVSYMSPEQISGRTTDVRSDMFSVGCLLYEMATGHRAFDRGTDLSTAAAILEGEPPAMRTKVADLPETLVAAVARCLRKDPAQRYQTVSELSAALRPLATAPREGNRRPTSADGPAPHTTLHLVGRKRERAMLHTALADADSGRPMMLTVSGEAGIGKTTIVEEFLDDLRNRNLAQVARGRCSERLAGGEAYLPILEMLESLLLDGAPGLEVRRVMSDVAPTWYAQLAPLSRGLDGSTQGPPGPLPTASQERMKRELRGLLDTLSQSAPLVLFLDDLHWADASTVDMLSYLCSRFETMRVLVIVTYRPTDLLLAAHPFANLRLDLTSRGLCREVPLGFLTRNEAERYLDLAYPGHHFPPELADVVHAKTEGSPLFMVDLVRDLRDRGLIASTPEGWTLARSIPAIERDLPHSVRSMIARKIGQLSDSDRQLLVCASVQGYTFDSAVVAAALGRDPGDIEERLEQLESVYSFIHVLGEDVLSTAGLTLRCQFVHVLYQNALHASIRATRRAAMSAAVAEALIRLHGSDHAAKASELAVLFEAAHQPIQAARAFLAAANNALRVYAYVETISSAERGLAQLANLPAADERDELELKLQVSVGTARVAIGGYAAPEVERAYARARELCRRIGNPQELASVLFGLFVHYVVVPSHEVCLELGQEMLLLAEREQSPALRIQGLLMQGMTRFWMGDVVPSVALLDEGISIYDRERHAIVGHNPLFDHGVGCRRYQAVALWLAGYPDQALVRVREAIEDARRTKHPLTVAPTLGFAAMLHHFRREVPETAATSEEAVACAREFGLTNWVGFAGAIHGWAAAHQFAPTGEGSDLAARAVGEIVACLERQTEASARRFRSLGSALLAEAHLQQGAVDEATLALDEGLRVAAETGEGFWEAELHRLRGDVSYRRGEVQQAEEHYERAIELATQRREYSLTLRALTSLLKLVRARPATSTQLDVLTRLGEVYGWFTEGFETHDLVEARKLLESAR